MSRVVFLLSPAHCGARRAQILLREQASFELALRIREMGAPLGEVFSFLSGLYFRGKLAYARTFARGAEPQSVSIITPGLGLRPADHLVTRDDLLAIAAIGASAIPSRPTRARWPRLSTATTGWCCSAASRPASTSTC